MTPWRAGAACREVDTDVFFAPSLVRGATWRDHGWSPAAAICRTCPVRVECLRAAVDEREEHAVRGGVFFWDRQERRAAQESRGMRVAV